MTFIPTAQRNRAADAVCARANNGSIKIYSGTPPTDADTALGAQTLLSTHTMAATAFGAAAAGVATANAIGSATAAASGKPSFARMFESDGTTIVCQFLATLAWLGSTAYSVGDYVHNGNNVYVCTTGGTSAASGGPTGTTNGITDGGVVWNYVGPAEVKFTGVASFVSGGNVSVSALTYTQNKS